LTAALAAALAAARRSIRSPTEALGELTAVESAQRATRTA
jgi:hypothetical protein